MIKSETCVREKGLGDISYHCILILCVCVHTCTQSCLILCDLINCSPPCSFVHGIFQARTLEWAAISSSRGSSQPRDRTWVSCVSCTGRRISLPLVPPEKPSYTLTCSQTEEMPPLIGEGDGNPLQCSCLENPRDGGAWWAAVYGVTQSQTWLKRLGSSSSWGRQLLVT